MKKIFFLSEECSSVLSFIDIFVYLIVYCESVITFVFWKKLTKEAQAFSVDQLTMKINY